MHIENNNNNNQNKINKLIKQIEIGNYLKNIRHEKRFSLAQVSRLINISTNYLSEIERGTKTPSDILIRNLSQLYNIDEVEIYLKYNKIPLGVLELIKQNNSIMDDLIKKWRETLS